MTSITPKLGLLVQPMTTLLYDVDRDCRIWLIRDFFTLQEADRYLGYFAALQYNEEPGMFGRPCLRKTLSFGAYEDDARRDLPVKYPYFKKVDIAQPWSVETLAIRDKVWAAYQKSRDQDQVSDAVGKKRSLDTSHKTDELTLVDKAPNYCLVNQYPVRRSGIGWHADDERSIVQRSPIFSVSFGASRTFAVRDRKTLNIVCELPLPHGSLLVMDGNTQQYYQHAVLLRGGENGVRFNLTMRTMI